ncbi:hypothetical protein V1511DRAFT_507837 [Dipodascopsis uninucleata]
MVLLLIILHDELWDEPLLLIVLFTSQVLFLLYVRETVFLLELYTNNTGLIFYSTFEFSFILATTFNLP